MPRIRQTISRRFRSRRRHVLCSFLTRHARAGQPLRIIDLGGSVTYWRVIGFDFLTSINAHITMVNLTDQAFTKEADAPAVLFAYVRGDACAVDAADNSFDVAHSNSVIEHVGDWPQMTAFAGEIRRLAPAYFVQTPNSRFPVDPHFPKLPMIHWLPRPVQATLHRLLPLAYSGRARDWQTAFRFIDGVRLLSRAQLLRLFPDSACVPESIAGFAKSYMMMRDAAVPIEPGGAQAPRPPEP